ncbi:SDR family oxidoreductase [Salinirubellus sp. GCM10025818]|jgi:NAD(P)-dependent dehydrogenase (short-subunit alcohol dehydrogenase family)|uniref:SDR family oxidoreductase n=1 Tax=Salinirubellus TaxID=2162630 RepID=UPI0030CB6FBB
MSETVGPRKTVLITGCSSGVGRATAEAFLDDDWKVYATARNPADIETLGEREHCDVNTLDVTDREDAERVASRMMERDGRIDALVNNAGYGQHGPLEDVTDDMLHRQFDVNVYGPHRLARAVLPHMREARDGTIVNVSSVAGRVAAPGMGAYAGSKHAVEGMSDTLRTEVEPFGVDVVVVQPGPVETSFRDRVGDELEAGPRTEAYESVYEFQEDATLVGGESPFAIPPEAVAETILEAAVSPDPQSRYPVGRFAELSLNARFLPDGLRDAAFSILRKLP